MSPRRTKAALPVPAKVVECPTGDRAVLIDAYTAGLIVAWKHDAERGYRLTFANRPEEYVEATKLTRYLQKLNGGS